MKFDKFIYSRYDKVKRLIYMFKGNLAFRKSEGNIGDIVEEEERLCNEVQ